MDTLGMHLRKKPGPDPGGPPGPRTAPRKQGGHRDRKPTKNAKTSQKHPENTQKHQNAPRVAALGYRQRRQRERGRAETESEQNYVHLAYWPLAVCLIETLDIFWSVHFSRENLAFGKVKPRNQSHPILE